MYTRYRLPSLFVALGLFATGAVADDLRNANRLICSTLEATVCGIEGECMMLLPADLNIPQFIEIDVKKKKLATTAASGENRQTTAQSVTRTDEQLILQGHENGRAYSLVIDELTGRASFASATGERGVIVFGACTPLAGK